MHSAAALLLALAAPCVSAVGICENWCSRWTCDNEEFCGGCDASICRGPNPHRMCQVDEQPYCGAPRCEKWCAQIHDGQHHVGACSRDECSGCPECASVTNPGKGGGLVDTLAASPFPAPEIVDDVAVMAGAAVQSTCALDFLKSARDELHSLVDMQHARNNELRAEIGLETTTLPPAVPRIPPLPPSPPPSPAPAPPPCVPVGSQCGGNTWTGPSNCCPGANNGATVCRWFSEVFSGCRHVAPADGGQ